MTLQYGRRRHQQSPSSLLTRVTSTYATPTPRITDGGSGLNLRATPDGAGAYAKADIVVIAAPTNRDPHLNFFDTTLVEQVGSYRV